MRNLRSMYLSVVAFVLLGAFSLGPVTPVAALERISFASSGVGAVFHVMVGGLAPYVSERIKDLDVTAEATRGSLENLRLVQKRESDMAFIVGFILYDAMHKRGRFKKSDYRKVRGVTAVYKGLHHWVTLANSGIRTMRDLKGKTVAVGPPGSGVSRASERALKLLGIRPNVKVRKMGWADAGNALKDGNIHAFAAMSAIPVPVVVNVAATHRINLLPVDKGLMKSIVKVNPTYFKMSVPGKTYQGVANPVPMLAYEAFWVAHEEVKPRVVYEMLKVTYKPKTRKFLNNVHPGWAQLTPGVDRMKKLIGLRLHPGAERYWREAGQIK